MSLFAENSCRLCDKIFCCESCRKKHEKIRHNVVPDCDICIYGKIKLSEVSEELFAHLQVEHWPLYCVWCKKKFNSKEDLKEHSKCSFITNYFSEKSPRSPLIQVPEETTFESPPLVQLFENNQNDKNLNVISTLATSTPMQNVKEDDNLFHKVNTVIITPVDSAESTKESILKKGSSRVDTSSKRRVTFCETILTDNMSSHDENQNIQSSAAEATPITGSSPGTFYSASQDSKYTANESKALSNTPKLPSTKKVSVFKLENEKNNDEDVSRNRKSLENNTVWISAINVSTEEEKSWEDSPKNQPSSEMYYTPFDSNSKKKQINVVMPTPIAKEVTFKFGIPMQISSTPHNSNIPVKTAKQIFQIPSSSKADCEVNEIPHGPIQISSTPNNPNIPVKSAPTAKEFFQRPSTSKSECELTEISEIPQDMKSDKPSDENRSENDSAKTADVSIQNKIWVSFNKLFKNFTTALQNLAKEGEEGTTSTSNQSMKRYRAEYNTEKEPRIKRYKLTDIKCRKSIREVSVGSSKRKSTEYHINIVNNVVNNVINLSPLGHKTFVDKSTQTDEWIPALENLF